MKQRQKTTKQVTLTGVEQRHDTRVFGVTLYDATELDRDGETIDVASVTAREPLTLQIDHDRSVLKTVGRVTGIHADGLRLRGTLSFAPAGVSEIADQVHRQVRAGVTSTVSDGFLGNPVRTADGPVVWKGVEVIELSFVSVPSSPGARVDAKALGEWLGQEPDDGIALELDDDDGPGLEVTDECAREVRQFLASCRRRTATAAERAGLVGEPVAHHRGSVYDINPREVAAVLADVLRSGVRDVARAAVAEELRRLRGRVD